MKLNPKQERFVAEYLVDLNATQAAMRAGYSGKTAAQIGSRLLINVNVAAAISEGRKTQAARVEITADWVLDRVRQLADFDPAKLYGDDGSILPIDQMPEVARRALAGIEQEEIWEGSGEDRHQVGVLRKLRFQPTLAALDKLMRHLGLYKDTLDIKVDQVTKAYGFDPYKKPGPRPAAGSAAG